jgi:hypothetical protein
MTRNIFEKPHNNTQETSPAEELDMQKISETIEAIDKRTSLQQATATEINKVFRTLEQDDNDFAEKNTSRLQKMMEAMKKSALIGSAALGILSSPLNGALLAQPGAWGNPHERVLNTLPTTQMININGMRLYGLPSERKNPSEQNTEQKNSYGNNVNIGKVRGNNIPDNMRYKSDVQGPTDIKADSSSDVGIGGVYINNKNQNTIY